jgi:hypothetical protein
MRIKRVVYAGTLVVIAFAGLSGLGWLGRLSSTEAKPRLDTNAAVSFGNLSEMVLLGDFTSKRASSWNRQGQNQDNVTIPPGETRVLMEESSAGSIDHIYWTYIEANQGRREMLFRGLVLRAYWDGVRTPSIEVPLGDFFGVSNGLLRPINSLAFVSNPGGVNRPNTRGFNCYLPMPFARGARIEIENQASEPTRIWFHIDYRLYGNPAAVPERAGRLHSLWRRENPTTALPSPESNEEADKLQNLTGKDNYVVLDVQGDGQFVGYFLTVVNLKTNRPWWGEGDDMIFIDGEGFPPSIHGTGSEEIFGGGACPATEFTGPYTGFHCIENWTGKWLGTNGMYRFYVNDPIRFRKSLRVTLEHGHANNRSNDYSSVAFWYQKGVNGKLPPLPAFSERRFRTDYMPAGPRTAAPATP